MSKKTKTAIVGALLLMLVIVGFTLCHTIKAMFNRTGTDGPIIPLSEQVKIQSDAYEGE